MAQTGTYRGDSPAKKIARIKTWIAIHEALGAERFAAGPHLVLSGPDAADVAVLFALGVPPSRIVATDIDGDALNHAAERFRKRLGVVPCHLVQADVAKMPELIRGAPDQVWGNGRRSFESIFLDFNGCLCPDLMEIIKTVATHGLRNGGVLAVNVLKGRESGLTREMLYALNRERMIVVFRQLMERPDFLHHWLLPYGKLQYESHNGDGKGSPMYTMFFVHRYDQMKRRGIPRKKAIFRAYEQLDHLFFDQYVRTSATDFQRDTLEFLRKNKVPTRAMALALNVPAGRLAAWKAWDTMRRAGTAPGEAVAT